MTTKTNTATLLDVWNRLSAKLSVAVSPDDLFMTPEEVSAYTGISVDALAMMRHRNKGIAYSHPTPRTTLYRKGDVDAWISKGIVQIVNPNDERLTRSEHIPNTGISGTPAAYAYAE